MIISTCLAYSTITDFILVGCILLRYLHILYKHTTQKLYICDPQPNNFFTLPKNFTTCFGSYGPSSGDIFEDFLLYCDTSIVFTSVRLSIVYNAKEVSVVPVCTCDCCSTFPQSLFKTIFLLTLSSTFTKCLLNQKSVLLVVPFAAQAILCTSSHGDSFSNTHQKQDKSLYL
jgi:hypothetical protein